MFRQKNKEEREQQLREKFVELWENKSSQHEHEDQPLLKAYENARIVFQLKDDPFHLLMHVYISDWLFTKEEHDIEMIKTFLDEVRVE